MKRFFTILKGRIAPLGILSFILAAAILYQAGVYDFSFIRRSDNYGDLNLTPTPGSPNFSGGAVENTDAPAVSDDVLDSLNSSPNISDNDGTSTPSEELDRDGIYESFPLASVYTAEGYSVSYRDYGNDQILAEITLDLPDAMHGANKLVVEFSSAREEEGSIPYSTKKFSSTLSMAVELYMGYLMIDDGSEITICTIDGKKIGSYEHTYMTPAYTRDTQNKPLFHLIAEGYDTYYELNEATGEFKLSKYDDEIDGRGLYYDYLPEFGLSDNGYKRFYHLVSCIVEMKKEDASDYIESGVPPANTSDTSSSSTAAPTEPGASAPAQQEQTAAPAAPSESPATGASELSLARLPRTEILFSTDTIADLLSGGSVTEAAPSPETKPETQPETVPETKPDVTPDVPESTSTPGSDTQGADSAPTSDTNPPAATTTGQKYSNYTISEDKLYVSVEIMERRWGFGRYDYASTAEYRNAPDESKLAKFYKYYRLYNFKDGLCAAVDRDGRMSFVNVYANPVVTRTGEYYGQSNRKFLTGYAEPLYKGTDAIGSLYFDEGYVMVRQIDIDYKYKDKLSGDYQYLVSDKGERFPIPAGYNLLSYSDGVLLLERDGYYGYYSTEGKWIAQPIFTYARPFAEGLGVLGFSGSKKGVIDRKGNLIVPFKYDYISALSCGTFAVYNEDGWKLIAKLEKQG